MTISANITEEAQLVFTSAGGRTEMDDFSDFYGEGSGLELVQVSHVLDYLGK